MANDFSNTVPGASPYTLPGNRYEQAPALAWMYNLNERDVPPGFPLRQWSDQQARYRVYWDWFNGDMLTETRSDPETGEMQIKFPLQINVMRKIARNHCSLLFGEAPDSPVPLVLTNVAPKNKLDGSDPAEEEINWGISCANIVNEVWEQSTGRAIQQEGGTLSQFLGGHAYQIVYDPDWDEGVIPNIYIRSWSADFFLPVWNASNRFELLEAYVVCRLEGRSAKIQYGYEGNATHVTYVEHWTKNTVSAFLDGQPITTLVSGEQVLWNNRPNIFGKVPFFYIPHLREGSFFGSSHVADIHGMIREYNERMADLADAIDATMDRVTWVKNTQNIERTVLPNGEEAFNLGLLAPGYNKDADAWVVEPPNFSAGLTEFPDKLYTQLRRETFNPPIADGEDEGSQRSGVTLDIRFWPATSHARAERTYWEAGLDEIAKFILHVVNTMNMWEELGVQKPTDKRFLKKLQISQQWHPQIPRDREAMINESVVRLSSGTMSPKTFIKRMADIPNINQELSEAAAFMAQMASIQAAGKPAAGENGNKPPDSTATKDSNFAQLQDQLNRS